MEHSLGQAALTCVQLHEGSKPLQAAIDNLEKYEPPARWGRLAPVFTTSGERTTWITQLVTRIWLAYTNLVRAKPVGFPPALYRAFTFHSNPTAPFSWEKANPTDREKIIEAITKIIQEDTVLSSIYKPHPELLLRKWWDELNGWCREYRSTQQKRWSCAPYGHETSDSDTIFSNGCPCPQCTITSVNEMLDHMSSEIGFAYSQRVAYEFDKIFPQSAHPQHQMLL